MVSFWVLLLMFCLFIFVHRLRFNGYCERRLTFARGIQCSRKIQIAQLLSADKENSPRFNEPKSEFVANLLRKSSNLRMLHSFINEIQHHAPWLIYVYVDMSVSSYAHIQFMHSGSAKLVHEAKSYGIQEMSVLLCLSYYSLFR